jgi:hypothetical protein
VKRETASTVVEQPCTRCGKEAPPTVARAGFLDMLGAAIVTARWGLWRAIAFWLFFVAVFATAASSLRLVSENELYRPSY